MLLMLGASEEAFMEHCIGASAEACHLNLSGVEILGGFSRCRSVACLYELIFLGLLRPLLSSSWAICLSLLFCSCPPISFPYAWIRGGVYVKGCGAGPTEL